MVKKVIDLTCKLLRLLCRHRTQVSQIALVSNQHDNNVGICVITQFFQPSSHVLVCRVLCDIVYQKSTNSAAVVTRDQEV